MKNYLYDHVNCYSENGGDTMNTLQAEGWKKLQFCRGGDFNSDYIQGYRPMTKKEIRDRERAIKRHEKEEIKELNKLAKRYKYKLVKINS